MTLRRRLSSTLKGAKTRRPSGTSATPHATMAWLFSSTRFFPFSKISPARRGIVPVIAASSVDLPAPFGPSSPTVSPCSTRVLTPCRTPAPPYLPPPPLPRTLTAPQRLHPPPPPPNFTAQPIHN